MNKKIAVIGSLTVDLFVKPSQTQIITQSSENTSSSFFALPHGGKVSADHIKEHFGGGSANVGVSFARLGNTVSCFGGIGDDSNGEKILKNLREENIHIDTIKKFLHKKSGFSLILNSFDGERTVIFTSEANQEFSYLSQDKKSNILENFDAIYLCHISTKDPEEILNTLNKTLEKHPEKKFFWNPGKETLQRGLNDSLTKKLLKHCDILFLNREESELFSGIKGKSNSSHGDEMREKHSLQSAHHQKKVPEYVVNVSEIAKKFLNLGVTTVVITDGRRGAQSYSSIPNEEYEFFPCVPGKRIDTLGAGDSFASAFSSFFLEKKSLKECGEYASINAASVVSFQGAQDGLLSKQNIRTYTK